MNAESSASSPSVPTRPVSSATRTLRVTRFRHPHSLALSTSPRTRTATRWIWTLNMMTGTCRLEKGPARVLAPRQSPRRRFQCSSTQRSEMRRSQLLRSPLTERSQRLADLASGALTSSANSVIQSMRPVDMARDVSRVGRLRVAT